MNFDQTLYTAVPGTWGWKRRGDPQEWFNNTSPFARFVGERGFEPLRDEPFLWSTDLNGLEGWRRWLPWVDPTGDHTDWHAGGHALRWYLEPYFRRHRSVIAHSHGGQVALYAAASGLRIPVLVTVATPVRKDMAEVVAKARPNIGAWLHIHATLGGDRIQWLGELGDGFLGITRQQPQADWNHGVPAIKHTRVLNDAALIPLWESNGWLDLISSEVGTHVG